MTDEELADVRAAGFRSADLYSNRLALALQGREVDDLYVSRHLDMVRASLQLEAQRLRENGGCEEMIAEYTNAAVERVMLRLQKMRSATPSTDTRN